MQIIMKAKFILLLYLLYLHVAPGSSSLEDENKFIKLFRSQQASKWEWSWMAESTPETREKLCRNIATKHLHDHEFCKTMTIESSEPAFDMQIQFLPQSRCDNITADLLFCDVKCYPHGLAYSASGSTHSHKLYLARGEKLKFCCSWIYVLHKIYTPVDPAQPAIQDYDYEANQSVILHSVPTNVVNIVGHVKK